MDESTFVCVSFFLFLTLLYCRGSKVWPNAPALRAGSPSGEREFESLPRRFFHGEVFDDFYFEKIADVHVCGFGVLYDVFAESERDFFS